MTQGLWIGLIGGAIIVGVFFIMALARKPRLDMKMQRSMTLESGLAPADAFARLRDGAAATGMKVELADAAAGRLVLSDGISLFSFGMFYPVVIAPGAGGAGGGARLTLGVSPRAPQWGPVVTHKLNKAADRIRTVLGS